MLFWTPCGIGQVRGTQQLPLLSAVLCVSSSALRQDPGVAQTSIVVCGFKHHLYIISFRCLADVSGSVCPDFNCPLCLLQPSLSVEGSSTLLLPRPAAWNIPLTFFSHTPHANPGEVVGGCRCSTCGVAVASAWILLTRSRSSSWPLQPVWVQQPQGSC